CLAALFLLHQSLKAHQQFADERQTARGVRNIAALLDPTFDVVQFARTIGIEIELRLVKTLILCQQHLRSKETPTRFILGVHDSSSAGTHLRELVRTITNCPCVTRLKEPNAPDAVENVLIFRMLN